MSLITLLTDFGIEDEYVGVMKGVILAINPAVTIVDLTHQIPPQDIIDAAYRIKSSYKYFPEKTVHLIVVDPGVGSGRPIIAIQSHGHYFLAPDNGILTPLLDEGGIESAVYVENSKYFLNSISKTFHGRDIFAPVAAYLSKGIGSKKIKIMELGRPADIKKLVRLSVEKPVVGNKPKLSGIIVSIDHFGNLITNIDFAILEKFRAKFCSCNEIKFSLDSKIVAGLSKSYNSAKPQTPLAIIGSRGYLEIAVNCGSAKDFFGVDKYDNIRVFI